jgi:adenine-specific DNA-methyltransferase
MAFASLANSRTAAEFASPWETLRGGRAASRALAASTPEIERVALARGFGRQVVETWWRAVMGDGVGSPSVRPPLTAFDTAELSGKLRALADDIGRAAAQLDDETAAYEIGLTYIGMLPTAFRGQYGVYYTPPALTARLITQATQAGTDWTTARVLDPACGGGAFLAPVVRRIIAALPGCSPRILIQNIAARLRGYEIDPFAAWFSQIALDMALAPICRAAGGEAPVLIEVCDSLRREAPREGFDLVIGNPPYGRITLPAPNRARYKRGLYGHANLYGLFTDMALRHTRPGGVVAFVTPTSFLAGEYFKNLRALLRRQAPPASMDFVSARKGVFDDVLQETVLAAYRRGGDEGPIAVHEIATAGGADVEATPAGWTHLPADPSGPWLLPRDASQAPLATRLSAMSHRLSDWGYAVSTGPLVWNRHKDQLACAPGADRRPLIWAEAITLDGAFMFRADKRGHTPYFRVRRGDDWLMIKQPCVLLQRTTAKEQARRLIAAALPASFLAEHGAVVVENHLNMVRPISKAPAVSADVLAAFLNSAAADRAFRCVSGSVAVSAYELEALPLPAPEALAGLRRLVGQGASCECVEAACAGLYGADP